MFDSIKTLFFGDKTKYNISELRSLKLSDGTILLIIVIPCKEHCLELTSSIMHLTHEKKINIELIMKKDGVCIKINPTEEKLENIIADKINDIIKEKRN